jgi:hypothetical protein
MAKVAKKIQQVELTEEETMILEAASLREQLEPFRALEKRYEELRKALVTIHKANLANGRNSNMAAPGWSISWREVQKPAYEVPARTEHHITFNRMVPSDAA